MHVTRAGPVYLALRIVQVARINAAATVRSAAVALDPGRTTCAVGKAASSYSGAAALSVAVGVVGRERVVATATATTTTSTGTAMTQPLSQSQLYSLNTDRRGRMIASPCLDFLPWLIFFLVGFLTWGLA